jgi:hypothetical protein
MWQRTAPPSIYAKSAYGQAALGGSRTLPHVCPNGRLITLSTRSRNCLQRGDDLAGLGDLRLRAIVLLKAEAKELADDI